MRRLVCLPPSCVRQNRYRWSLPALATTAPALMADGQDGVAPGPRGEHADGRAPKTKRTREGQPNQWPVLWPARDSPACPLVVLPATEGSPQIPRRSPGLIGGARPRSRGGGFGCRLAIGGTRVGPQGRQPSRASAPTWWSERDGPTRLHSEPGRETSQRPGYCPSKGGRAGRRQV